jgi:hypothetical protein
MTAHAKLSPSKRDRWSRCPASVREEAKYPEERSGASAIDGTHSHTLLSHCIENHVDATEMIGIKLSDHEGEFVVDAERAERVQSALNYIDERVKALGDCKVYSEVKVDLSPIFGRTDLNGTTDVVIISNDTLEVIDYKDGRGEVIVTGNLQLDQYTWGIVAQLGANLTQTTIRQTIIQPKMRGVGSNGITWSQTSIDEFLSGKDRLAAEAAACDDPDAPFNPGEKQCQWCRHKGACSALANQNMAAMGIDLTKMNMVQDAVDKEPSTMTDQQIREIIEAAPLIRQMLDAVEKEALARLDSGKVIEGLKLVRGRGSRSWAYPEDVMATKLIKLGIPKGELYKTSIISPAQAEKLTWKKRDGTVKQLTERQLAVLHDEYITKSDGKLTVASAFDERPAVVRDVSSMFAPIVEAAAPLPDFLQVPDWMK